MIHFYFYVYFFLLHSPWKGWNLVSLSFWAHSLATWLRPDAKVVHTCAALGLEEFSFTQSPIYEVFHGSLPQFLKNVSKWWLQTLPHSSFVTTTLIFSSLCTPTTSHISRGAAAKPPEFPKSEQRHMQRAELSWQENRGNSSLGSNPHLQTPSSPEAQVCLSKYGMAGLWFQKNWRSLLSRAHCTFLAPPPLVSLLIWRNKYYSKKGQEMV